MLKFTGRNIGDEGFSGANVIDTENKNRFSKEGAQFIAETIKKAIAPVNFDKSQTNKNAISIASSNLMQTIEKNTLAAQEVLQENIETEKEFKKLIEIMAAAQEKSGEASVRAIREAIKQIERIKLSSDSPDKVDKALNLNQVQENLSKQLGRQSIGGAIFQKLFNVDLRTEKASSAFSAEKLFGLDGGSKDTLSKLKDQVKSEIEAGDKGSAQRAVAESISSKSEDSAQKTSAQKTSAQKISSKNEENAQGGEVFRSGIDRESLDNKKVELLEDILKELKQISENTSAGLLDFLPDGPFPPVPPPGSANRNGGSGGKGNRNGSGRNNGNASRSTSRFPKLSRGFGGVSRFLGPALAVGTVGMDLYSQSTTIEEIENAVQAGQISPEEGQSIIDDKKNTTTGQLAGTALGIAAGTVAAGALTAIGAPVLATVGAVGAIGFGLYKAGQAVGDAIVTTPEEAALEKAKESGLYKSIAFGKSQVDKNVLSNTNDIQQLHAIINDNDISASDKFLIGERISQITSGVMEGQAIPNYNDESRFGIQDKPIMNQTSPEVLVTPTADAVDKTTDRYQQIINNTVTNIFNTNTNNNGGSQPILVSPPSVRDFRFYQHGQKTRF
jgi:hypothetical protein